MSVSWNDGSVYAASCSDSFVGGNQASLHGSGLPAPIAEARSLPENPRLVTHREFAEAAQLQREAVRSEIVE